MSKRSFRTALAVVIGSLVLVAVLVGWFINRALAYPNKCPAGAEETAVLPGSKLRGSCTTTCKATSGVPREVEVEIKAGMSFPTIATLLANKGLLAKPTWFRLYAMWEGKTTSVKTGKYVMTNILTPCEVLATLTEGVKEVTVKVTLPEGKTMLEFFELIEKAQIAKARELEALARDKTFLGKFAITADSVEGYLFPDTYQFRINEKPQVVLTRLISRHQEVWNELAAKHPKDTAKLKEKTGWSDRDILTMASIVEKEAVVQRERPIIARVFINRLTSKSFKPKKLQTDPTIRYGCMVPVQKSAACIAWHEPCLKANPPKPMGCDRLHRAQLDDMDNPYNTYAHEGLPPGPISNPGRASIEATLAPDDNDYFYFVAKAKGASEHAFAKSVDEHERNVKKYVGTLAD